MNLEKKKVNIRLLYNENNENHLGVSPLALRALSEYVKHSNRYPINTLAKLLSYLHNLYDLPFYNFDSLYDEKVFFEVEKESKILLGIGSTEILRAVALCYGKGGGEIIEASPAYSFVSSSAKQIWGNSIKIVNVPLSIDYRHDWKSFVKVLFPNTKVVVVTNPNNPTGTALSYDELVLLADNLENDILLVIDEAYIELATRPDVRSMVDLTKHRSNILITRTFSKFYGLAGLRLGYGIGSACVIEKIRNYLVGLMGINKLAAVAAYASLKDRDYQNRTVEMVNQGKKK